MRALETRTDIPEAEFGFEAYAVDPGERIDARKWDVSKQGRPIACFVKPDGAVGDRPSLAFIVQTTFDRAPIAVQISVDMFEPILKEIERLKANGTKTN